MGFQQFSHNGDEEGCLDMIMIQVEEMLLNLWRTLCGHQATAQVQAGEARQAGHQVAQRSLVTVPHRTEAQRAQMSEGSYTPGFGFYMQE